MFFGGLIVWAGESERGDEHGARRPTGDNLPPMMGNLMGADAIRDRIGPITLEDAAAMHDTTGRGSCLDHIRNYQEDPSNDLSLWNDLMRNFSPELSLTFDVYGDSDMFFINVTRAAPIFRAAWVLAEGSTPIGFSVKMFDPEGELVYTSRKQNEGIIAIEATIFGEYVLEFTTTDRAMKYVTLLQASSSFHDIMENYDLKGAKDGANKLVKSSSDLKRAMRFFQRRRSTHQTKIERNLKYINCTFMAVLICSVLVALLQVVSIKHLVRRRLRTMIY